MNRRAVLAGGLIAASPNPVRAAAQNAPSPYTTGDPWEIISLWPGTPGGAPAHAPVAAMEDRSRGSGIANRMISGIARPNIAVFRPQQSNGTAVLIAPGGGYRALVIDRGGYEPARWLAARGFTAFVLTYRLPGEGWARRADVPLSDAQRAVRLIRHDAARFAIDPRQVVTLGFSAGGHVCAELLTRFSAPVYSPIDAADRLSARPSATAMVSAVISMVTPGVNVGSRSQLLGVQPPTALERVHSPHLNVPGNASPSFLVATEDDTVAPIAPNALLFRAALRERGASVETHIFARGGHNFGVRMPANLPASAWPDLFVAWLHDLGRTPG